MTRNAHKATSMDEQSNALHTDYSKLTGVHMENSVLKRYIVHVRCTVQTFNSYTSQLDVCYYLVIQEPMLELSKSKPSTSMTPRSLQIKAKFSCEVIHAFMPRKQLPGGIWMHGCVLCYILVLYSYTNKEIIMFIVDVIGVRN